MVRSPRKPAPYLALGTVADPATPVPLPGVREVVLNVEHVDLPDLGTSEIKLQCSLCGWTVRVRVEPTASRVVIPIAGTTDLLGAFNHGRLAFPHPECPARPETTANELRRLVQDAYLAGRTSANLP